MASFTNWSWNNPKKKQKSHKNQEKTHVAAQKAELNTNQKQFSKQKSREPTRKKNPRKKKKKKQKSYHRETLENTGRNLGEKHKVVTQKRSDKDRMRHTGLNSNKADKGKRCRRSEARKGQVRDRDGCHNRTEGWLSQQHWKMGWLENVPRWALPQSRCQVVLPLLADYHFIKVVVRTEYKMTINLVIDLLISK